MSLLARFVLAIIFATSTATVGAQSILEQLRGPALGGGQNNSGGLEGSQPAQGSGQGASSSDAIPTITNVPKPPKPPAEGADARRRAQQLELQQLHQQLDLIEAGTPSRNSFQNFVLQATGRDIGLFGTNLFRNTPSTFAPVDNIPLTPDYIIGPGDELLIAGWGQIKVDLDLIVDRNGTINVPTVGVLNVAGLKYEDLTPFLKRAFGRVFKNFELTATLGQLRSIQVFVVGQAKRPGTYTVSSLSTLVNAVFAAGGPASTGSMRSVQLKRENRVVVDFDLYDLLVAGDKSRDVRLMPGDIIQFSAIGPLVAITGAVNNEAIYELKQNSPLFDVIRWAGGLATTAEGQKVTVERIEDRKVRKIEEFGLDMNGLSRLLKDGDLVAVHSLVPRFENAVTLRGNVLRPGRFPWREGMRVKDLIPDREALVSPEYLRARNQIVGIDEGINRILRQQSATGTELTVEDLYLRRTPPDEPDATIGDAIRRSQTEAEASRFLSRSTGGGQPPRAESPRPGQFVQQPQQRQDQTQLGSARRESLRLVNQIKPSPYEVNWNYAVIERTDPTKLSTSLIPFNLGLALDGDPQQNIVLQRGDVVSIFSKDDFQAPISSKTKYVVLEGELKSAGVYEILPGETLRQLVLRVGGVTPNAYLFGASFTRDSTRVEQQKNIDEALSRLERDIQRYNIVRAQNVTSGEDAASLKQLAENQEQLVGRLRQIRATGRIVLEIPENGDVRDIPDITLENGDRLFIPAPPSMVSVFGSVYSENSFIYRPQKQVSDYLGQAGGPTKSADKSSIYVLRADGSVLSKQQSSFFLGSFDGTRLMPGDSIVVPEELEKTTITRALKDISQIFYQFGLGAAAIKVLRQ